MSHDMYVCMVLPGNSKFTVAWTKPSFETGQQGMTVHVYFVLSEKKHVVTASNHNFFPTVLTVVQGGETHPG